MTQDHARRFTVNILGKEEDVDGASWSIMGNGNQLGLEAIKLNDEGKVILYISTYEGIVLYDYNPEITAQVFFERAEKAKNAFENQMKQSGPVREIYG